MNTACFRFTVGRYDCMAVSDGYVAAHDVAHALFKNAPENILQKALLAHDVQVEKYLEVFTPLLIQTGEHCVLVDTGLGLVEGLSSTARLLPNLQGEGIKPGDIDTVVITHAHGDHVGGNTDAAGTPAFPEARYFIHKVEWDFWTSENTLNDPKFSWNAGFINGNLLSIKERIELIDQDIEIVPGIKSVFAPGHTPGNIVVLVTSNDQQLLYLGDAVLHPIHMEHPEWYGEVDILPEQTVNCRRRLFERADKDHMLCIAFHFDFPGLGYIEKYGGAWKWRPVKETG